MSSNGQEIGQLHRINPNSLMNLRPAWQPGQSGNPGGRIKGAAKISSAYERLLQLEYEDFVNFKPKNMAEAIAYRQVGTAFFGFDPLPSTKEITDRTEGRAPQKIELNVQQESLRIEARTLMQVAVNFSRKLHAQNNLPFNSEALEALKEDILSGFADRPDLFEIVAGELEALTLDA